MSKPISFVAPFAVATYQKRRRQLMTELSKRHRSFTAIFFSGHEVVRNSDAHFTFRAHSDFLYLTGFAEPLTVMLLQVQNGKFRTSIGVRPRDLSSTRGSEIWEGERVGVERAPKLLGFDEAFDIAKSDQVIQQWSSTTPIVVWSFGEYSDWDHRVLAVVNRLTAQNRGMPKIHAVVDPRPVLHEQRKLKSPEEVAMMRRSADIATAGHLRAMQTMHPGLYEYQVAAEVERGFKREGAQAPSYNSIVATGNNACTLHYTANNCRLGESDLILIDAGAEYFGYASDITRCYPASGRFTEAQREVYSWVLKSQLAAIRACRPGALCTAPHDVAAKVISKGLKNMGFFKGASETSIYKTGLYKKYFPHGTSHWLGLDVHDVGIYKEWDNPLKPVRLKAGNVLTIEPGLYFRADDSSVPKRLRGIGVRIEDDVLITKTGHDVLTARCPKAIDEIESLCGPKL